MESRNPALWENGQYLEEWDPVRKNRHSDAARKAQAARLIKNRPPRDILPRRELAGRGPSKPPLHYYGFPFTKQYAIDYARRHHFTVPLMEDERDVFGGKEVFDFSEINESHFADPEVAHFIVVASRHFMLKDLSDKCGLQLQSGRPFSLEWDGIVALWSNYDVKERYPLCYDYDEVVDILTSAMNEGDGPKSKLQWWFDWDNDVGVFTSVD
ncbi:hypothetical protein L227DRAFT_354422 [Lentinus tigrinus ALCF2SS1-6]|uniref:Uncharacterized protein n=1 Tax=Lentinus tigrinus ALCF2SS1-6 TaxID=1328759 RepID=A0A5C2RRL2_9APHY|nr:hypothetical protein L227DRAFT_354422 [Lentinus tigrinus ALCF2SS1-6]